MGWLKEMKNGAREAFRIWNIESPYLVPVLTIAFLGISLFAATKIVPGIRKIIDANRNHDTD